MQIPNTSTINETPVEVPTELTPKLDNTSINIFDAPSTPVAPEAPTIPEAPVVETPAMPEIPAAPETPAVNPAPPAEENPFGNLVEQTPPIDGLNQPFSAIGVEGKEMPEEKVSSNTEIINHIPKEEVPTPPSMEDDIELPMLNTNDAQNTLNNLSGETFEIK